MNKLLIDGNSLTLEKLEQVCTTGVPVVLAEQARARMLACRKVIEQAMDEGKVIYGVNTGFGKFSDIQINPENLEQLQENLVLSHAAALAGHWHRKSYAPFYY